MSKFRYVTAATLNGFLADETDSLDWLFAVGGEAPELDPLWSSTGVSVMGSTTYEWVLRHEDVLAHPERWSAMPGMGDRPVFVFSGRRLDVPAGADVRVVSGPVEDALPGIREAAAGKDVWLVGGGELVGAFDDAGALDEVQVSIAPALLPAGRPILPRRIGPDRLHLREVLHVGQFAHLVYDVRR